MSSSSQAPPSETSVVVERLRALIEEGGYKPGMRLPPERALAEALGIGRPALREAIKALSILDVLESRRGDGTYVKSLEALKSGWAPKPGRTAGTLAGLREIAPISKVEQARRAILEAIFAGVFRPGDRLVEASLARQLGVSQATVNQALQELDSQGIVNKSLNRETTIRRFGLAELDALFPVRLALECMAAEEASRRLTRETLDGLRRHLEHMRTAARSEDLPGMFQADFGFHQELYRMSQNRFLIQACQAVAAAPFVYLLCERLDPGPTDHLRTVREHEEILAAIEKGPETAAGFVRAKITEWHDAAVRSLGGKPAGEAQPAGADRS